MIKITKTWIAAFMKVRNPLVVWCREKKKTEDGENVFFRALAKIFLLIPKKLFMADLLSNGLHEKIIIYYVITLYY